MNVTYWQRDESGLFAKNLARNVFPLVSASLLPFHQKIQCFDDRTSIIIVNALVSVNFFIALQSGAILDNLTLTNSNLFRILPVESLVGQRNTQSLAHFKTLMRKRPSCRELQ